MLTPQRNTETELEANHEENYLMKIIRPSARAP
jgi:hypothetical protein